MVAAANYEGLDLDALRVHREYLEKYYWDRFERGQGSDRLLELLETHQRAGRWLDLGCGTTTMLWALALQQATSLALNDLNREAVVVLREFAESNVAPPCYLQALGLVGRDISALEHARELVLSADVFVFDALTPWPTEMAGEMFSQITAIGTFGLAGSPAEYTSALARLTTYLAPNGVAIGANWRRRDPPATIDDPRRNAWLAPRLVEEAARAADARVSELEWVGLPDDGDYDGVLLWTLKA